MCFIGVCVCLLCVGQKVAATMATPVQGSLLDYYDIMVIGKTGAGKSTTVDKLLIAWLPGQQQQRQHPQQQPEQQPGQPQQEASETEATHKPEKGTLQCRNMTMWLISDQQIEKGAIRLKNMVFFRDLDNSHKEIDKARKHNTFYGVTEDCELFSNELTKLRVLDVPGFFGNVRDLRSDDLECRMKAVQNYDLFTMRTILGIKTMHNFKFNRIVYFLPDKGALTRASEELIAELSIMKEYFGRPIFESMVVVATLPSDVYRFVTDENLDLFPEDSRKETKKYLCRALQKVFKSDDVPDPPIIFISLYDTCEEILRKIQTAEVKQDSLDLKFTSSICARCDKHIIREGEATIACSVPGQQGRIPLDESTCHPLLIPKYSKIEKILGGIAHVITRHHYVGRWADFKSMDEKCIGCASPPNTHGCMKIGSKFEFGKEIIEVQHSNSAADYVEVGQDNGEAEDEQH